jgi:SNF2 family DNA or RNA helicase
MGGELSMEFVPSRPQQILIDKMLSSNVVAGFVGVGIGKTASALYALNDLLLNLEAKAALIIAPLRVCSLTWPHECQKFEQFKWMRVVSLRTEEGRRAFVEGSAQAYLINFEMLPKLEGLIKQRKGSIPYDLEIIDELHIARSHSSKRINGFRKLPRAPRRWGLTGTPAPNSLMDLFAQIRLLDSGEALGKSFTQFQQRWFESDWMGWNWTPKPFAKEQIHKAISHLTVTLSSEEWLDIPDTFVIDEEIDLPARDGYNKLKRELLLEIKGKTVTAANAAVLIGKLQQYVSGAVYTDDGYEAIHDAKLDALEKIYKRLKKPLLVACHFRSEQPRIKDRFPEAILFEAAKTAEDQRALVAKWNAGKIPMLIASPDAAGTGLNLQDGGDTIVWFTLTYSRLKYIQTNARLARRGQKNVTTVYRLLCPNTVDDAVVEALREKETEERSLLSALKILEAQR